MVFPVTPLDVNVELSLNSVWQDITSYVFDRDAGAISIARGSPNESNSIDPSTLNATLNNLDGRFSPRNPVSPYYTLIGRNTPIRVSVDEGAPFLALPGVAGAFASAPDTAGTSVTGDIDIRVELAPNSNNSEAGGNAGLALATKYNDTGNQRAWAWWIRNDGVLSFRWSTDGINQKNATATSYLKFPPGRTCLRVTMDVDSGGGTSTVTFYSGATMAGPWSMVGDPVVRPEITSIFDSSEPINIGVTTHISGITPFDGRVYRFELRNGIGGSVVASPDFTTQTVGATSFADAAGNTWSVQGTAAISNRNYRFCGEVASWPQKWDVSGKDVYVPIQASGITRRLGQGTPVVKSALFREFTNPPRANIVAYWSCEDASGSKQLGSAFPDHSPGIVTGSPEFAADDTYVASQPLPKINDGRFSFSVPAYTVTAETSMRVYMGLATATATANRLFSVRCTGTAAYWELKYSIGTATLVAKDAGGNVLLSVPGSANLDGLQVVFDLELTEVAGNVNYSLKFFLITGSQREAITAFSLAPGTLNGVTVGKVINISVAPDGDLPVDDVVGHVVLANSIGAYANTAGAMFAWQDEEAADRLARLCAEEGVAFIRQGFAGTTQMGAQTADSLPALIQECVNADQGVLFEPRDRVGLGYVSRGELYNQQPQLALAYNQGNLIGSLDPVDDDQQTRNDVTVSRKFGASSRAVLDTGALSVQSPPGGVGRYDVQVTQNLGFDFQLDDASGWLLHLGTVDESRYPTLGINLAHPAFSGNSTLTERALLAEQGSRITVSGLPAWLPPDAVTQLIQGYTEAMRQKEWSVVFNTSPESPYHVGVAGDPVLGHAGTEGSQLAASATSTSTTLSVATTAGPIWTTDPTDLPFDVKFGGEVVTVTAISGASSPQTFTVTRSVNGVVKAHSAGEDVRLAQPLILAL